MTLDVALDVLAGLLLVVGAFLSFAAGMGIVHFPDLLARMHAGTKPQVLGMLFMLIALGIRLRSWSVAGILLLVILFQMLSAPVGAHMVARAGYRTGKIRSELMVFDELTADTEAADAGPVLTDGGPGGPPSDPVPPGQGRTSDDAAAREPREGGEESTRADG